MAAALLIATPARPEGLPDDPYEVGIRKLDQGEWQEALPIYREITRANPAYPWGWLGLGWSLHYTGHPGEAIPAYRRAIALGAQPPRRMLLEIARCHAALGNRDSTYAALQAALDAGLTNLERLGSDARFAIVRGEPRFRELLGLPDSTITDRVTGWRRDLGLLSREVKRMHRAPFRKLSEADFDRSIDGMADSIAWLDDDALGLSVMRLVSRLGDGHSWADPLYMQRAHEEALPVEFEHFDDGLFVTAASPDHEDLLWARVEVIGGVPASRVLAALEPVVSKENAMRVLSVGPELMRFPRLLHALGIARAPDRVELKVRDRRDRSRRVTLAVGPIARRTWVRQPATGGDRIPLYARRRSDWYWFETLPGDSTLYLQYNACADKDSESVASFSRRLLEFVDRHEPKRLIVDLRWNGGGDLSVNGPLLEAIVQSRSVNRPGRLFVITSRHTFSTTMNFAAQLERYTHAIFAGEPTGSSPNFVGETNFVTLPFSGIRVSLSNLEWQNSIATDARVWIPARIPVPWTFASYRAGRDPVVEAILRYGW